VEAAGVKPGAGDVGPSNAYSAPGLGGEKEYYRTAITLAYARWPKNVPVSTRRRASFFRAAARSPPMRPVPASTSAPRSTMGQHVARICDAEVAVAANIAAR